MSVETADAVRLGVGDGLRAMALLSPGSAEASALRIGGANRHLEQGIALARRIGRPYLELAGLVHEAQLAVAGSYTAGAGLSLQAIELARRHGWNDKPVTAVAHTVHAAALVAQGRVTEAESWIDHAQRILHPQENPVAGFKLYYVRARIELARGEYTAALATLEEVELLSHALGTPHVLRPMARAHMLHALVRSGEVERADRALADMDAGERDGTPARTAEVTLRLAEARRRRRGTCSGRVRATCWPGPDRCGESRPSSSTRWHATPWAFRTMPETPELSRAERDVLEGWTRRGKTAQALAMRARIVLACAQGESSSEVSRQLGVSLPTVGKWRKRFVEQRLGGLCDEPRPGPPRTIDDARVEMVIVKTLEEQPSNQDSHWSTRSMAAATGMSQTAISRIWRAFGLKPHLVDTWKLSSDPLFIDEVRDVVGLYLDPPAKAMVLAVDEKTQMQALDRSAPMLPMMPGTPERKTHDYVRYGTTSLSAALDIATGTVIGRHQRRHRHQEFLRFLKTIDHNTPAELDLHLICDNYATHKTPAIQTWLAAHPRFHLHFTPTSSSWLNLVERWFAELTNRKLRRSAHRSVKELEDDVNAWIAAWNTDPKPVVWTKTADEILANLAHYCARINKTISDSGH